MWDFSTLTIQDSNGTGIEGQPNAGDKDADGWNLEEKTNPSAMSSIINLKWNDVVLK